MNKKLPLLLTALSLALLSACGQKEDAAPDAVVIPAPAPVVAPDPAPAPAPAPDPIAENAVGKSVYGKTCAMCHAIGAAGAPKPGDTADWAPRIAQGMDLLNTHAIQGFTGAKGVMPPRGGAASLTDDEVKAAVAYMVDQSK